MSEYINKQVAIILPPIPKGHRDYQTYNLDDAYESGWYDLQKCIKELPPEDVQPVTFCKDCQWLADIKDVETGELYHTCGVLAFDVPDGFACNQGKRKGADNV